ncbi:Matrix remodeling-associated protein 8 Plasma membrane protein 1B3 Precursor [Larimichthys crocea]|uniref:Matrix remodeling-associated protein 8 n=1 Tax=Larimichthys crocea TaxID=215358 RepID=A0A6G0J4Y7_LARCR|nr:Matrix remodeling-associated protein 8 Plasma membrane protein 1B3 Precursor [Larimichthys crocea]
MKVNREDFILQALLLIHIPVVCLFTAVSGQSDSSSSVVVAGYNVSAPAGSSVVLQCVSGRMVWTRDRRIYNSYNQGRVGLSPTAFKDGNFSLVIKDVTMNDRGLYSCNLHHHYCHLYETVRVQLNITKSRRKEQRFWDGQKAVFVVLLGSTVVLPCINRRNVWTDWSNEEEDQQVVHWDRQSPGIRHDRADRLVDLETFSLTISDLQITDQGMYSCHLHHHYCGLHERREFQVTVEPPVIQTTLPAKALPSEDKDTTKPESPRVINVILPDQRHHFLLPLGYVLTSFLLLAFVILIIVLVTCRRRNKEYYPQASMR